MSETRVVDHTGYITRGLVVVMTPLWLPFVVFFGCLYAVGWVVTKVLRAPAPLMSEDRWDGGY